MPYTIRKQKCKNSKGNSGTHVLSYTDKKGKKHRACHTSKKGARGQIAAIEGGPLEGIDTTGNTIQEELHPTNEKIMKIRLSQLRQIIRETIEETIKVEETNDDDLNKDGENDFEDVMIARMKASGMSHDNAVKKGEKAANKAVKK